ncbi:MAG: phage portal protein [Proteobacteria bacterium]|nr:phage portal protein [Pseudomonadota bacterium]
MFSRFKTLLGFESKSGIAEPDQWLVDLFAAATTAAGISITPRFAMRVPAVRCAVQAISETIGQLPVHIHERVGGGGKERAPDHPAYGLVRDFANDWTSSSTFREEITRDALLFANGGFAFINRVEGRPLELQRLDPERMTVAADPRTSEPLYQYASSNSEKRTYRYQDILHIPSPSLSGRGLINDASEAIGTALVMEQYAARLFANGARPSGMLTIGKGGNAPDALTKAKAAWLAAHGGNKSGGTAVMPEGSSYTPLTLTSVDAQFLELRQFYISEIARVFRVPPVFLQDYGRATWGNAEAMGQQFLTYSLMPWIKRWEGELRLKLLTPDERKIFTIDFLVDDLLRADFDKRMEGYSKAIASRILNPNEARAAENRLPYAGGDAFENPHVTVGAP